MLKRINFLPTRYLCINESAPLRRLTKFYIQHVKFIVCFRYIAVVYALRYPNIVTKKRVQRCLVFIWTFSFVVTAIAFSRQFVDDKATRMMFNASFMTVWALVIFVLPMCVIIFTYAKVKLLGIGQYFSPLGGRRIQLESYISAIS